MNGWGTVKVKRIEERREGGGISSTVWPEFDDSWSPLMQLRWHAAVAMLDSGTDVKIHVQHGTSSTNGIPRDEFCVSVGGTGYSSSPFQACWTLITGIGSGLRAAKDRYFPPQWQWVNGHREETPVATPLYDEVKRRQAPLFEALAAKHGFSPSEAS